MMIGLYALIAKNNLVKKIVGMNIFQTAIILVLHFHRRQSKGPASPLSQHGSGHGHEAAVHGRGLHQSAAPRAHADRHRGGSVATLGVALALVIKSHGTALEPWKKMKFSMLLSGKQ